jgi:hypothetical protein
LAERNRRYPKRPVLFWAVFGLVAVSALGVAFGFTLQGWP